MNTRITADETFVSSAAAVGFLGPPGTFSEQAARAYLDSISDKGATLPTSLVPYKDIPDLLTAVHHGEVSVGVVPVENSIEGTVVVTLDMLVHEVDLAIIDEIVIPVRHHLLVRSGGGAETEMLLRSVRTVVSHPQALAQCRRYLQTHLPHAMLQSALSTAAAAQKVGGTADADVAAIGTELCAELYGLTVVAKDIQDVADNATRFFAVTSRELAMRRNEAVGARPTGRDKTSVVFGFAVDEPGNLYGALGEFANRGLNLSKLESRPTKHALGHYLFFVDLDGHRQDAAVAEALDALARRCAYMKILGSYPKAPYPPLTRPRWFPPGGLQDSRRP